MSSNTSDEAMLEVVEARYDEAELLFDTLMRAFREYEGRLDPPSGVLTETIEGLAAKLATGGALVCRSGFDIVGCAVYQPKDGYLYVGRFGVVPEYRRSGAGTKLLAAAEARASELGFTRVRLNVRLALERLIAYYEARGYRPIRYIAHAGYAADTYVEMEKCLGEEP